jgi:hypothetical protein
MIGAIADGKAEVAAAEDREARRWAELRAMFPPDAVLHARMTANQRERALLGDLLRLSRRLEKYRADSESRYSTV